MVFRLFCWVYVYTFYGNKRNNHMTKLTSYACRLFYKVRLLSELSGVDIDLSFGRGKYSIDKSKDSKWKKVDMSYQYMDGYIDGMINAVVYLSNDIKNLPEEYLDLIANDNLCKKFNIISRLEYITTGIGSYDEWESMVLREKQLILNKKYGRKNNNKS